jgi:hypothetical protein
LIIKTDMQVGAEQTPMDLMDTQFSLEDRKICTSPVTGSSISPVSPATFDRRLARTSDPAVSNYVNPREELNTTSESTETEWKNSSERRTHQREVVRGRLPDPVGQLGVEGVEVLDGDGDMVAVVHEALAGTDEISG